MLTSFCGELVEPCSSSVKPVMSLSNDHSLVHSKLYLAVYITGFCAAMSSAKYEAFGETLRKRGAELNLIKVFVADCFHQALLLQILLLLVTGIIVPLETGQTNFEMVAI